MNALKLLTTLSLMALLGGCATMDQLSRVGEAPKLTAIADPTAQPGYTPVNMPMPAGSSRTSARTRLATS
jgi:flagellar L-ring protein precursor FlgH